MNYKTFHRDLVIRAAVVSPFLGVDWGSLSLRFFCLLFCPLATVLRSGGFVVIRTFVARWKTSRQFVLFFIVVLLLQVYDFLLHSMESFATFHSHCQRAIWAHARAAARSLLRQI